MADVQIAIIDQQNTQIALAAPSETQVNAAVPGVQGPAGEGVPQGGTANQVLFKQSGTDYDTAWGEVTSAMIGDLEIVDADVAANAEIAVSKLADGSARQLLQTDAAGTGVEWTSNVDVPGTLDVTGATTLDSTLTVPAGSAASPTLRFSGDANTGVYSPGADQLALSTSGTGKLFIDSAGKVTVKGVGTAAFVVEGTAPDNSLFVEGSTGYVGIGTSVPQKQLDVYGDAGMIVRSTSVNTTETPLFLGGNISNNQRKLALIAKPQGSWGRQDLLICLNSIGNNSDVTSSDAVVTIKNNGLVGIGTTSPGAKLEIRDAADADLLLESTDSTNRKFSISANSSGNPRLNVISSHALEFHTNDTERMQIDSSGRLLVGTSSALTGATAQYSKNVNIGNSANSAGNAVVAIGRGTAAASLASGNQVGSIYFTDNGAGEFASIDCFVDATPGVNDYPGRLVFSTTADGASSPTERMRITNDGKVLIGNDSLSGNLTVKTPNSSFNNPVIYGWATNSSYTDTVISAQCATAAGTGYRFFTGYAISTIVYQVLGNGNVQNTNNSYGAISDVKLKENIVDANSQWDDLKALRVRNYNLKEGQTHTQIGLVAQEVELVSPGLVTESPDRDEDGNDLGTVTKSVNYSVLYMKAVKALQEAMERIETLEQRLNDAGIN